MISIRELISHLDSKKKKHVCIMFFFVFGLYLTTTTHALAAVTTLSAGSNPGNVTIAPGGATTTVHAFTF